MQTLRELSQQIRNAGHAALADGVAIWATELERYMSEAGLPLNSQPRAPDDKTRAMVQPAVPAGGNTLPPMYGSTHLHGSGSAPPAAPEGKKLGQPDQMAPHLADDEEVTAGSKGGKLAHHGKR